MARKLTQYISLAYASDLTGISTYTLKKYIDAGLMVAFMRGDRYRINIDDLEYFINYIYENEYYRELMKRRYKR